MKVVYFLQVGRKTEGAAYNRVAMMCEGLRNQGVDCRLLLSKSYPLANPLFSKVWTLINLFLLAGRMMSLSAGDVFIVYGENILLKYLLKFPRRAKLWVERNEYPTYLIRDNLSGRQIAAAKQFEKLLSACDGMIVCSGYLKNYYSQYTSAPITIVPLVVDTRKFTVAEYPPGKYIAYCGDFGGNKDGLPLLLEAFARVSVRWPEYKLYLIGDTQEDDTLSVLNGEAKRLGISQQVVFTGRVPHDRMPALLGKAALLVLARPANKQAEGGIPSKLAEYMATGRPVLVTRVGELKKYFTDQENIFFAEPGSPEDFAAGIEFIFSHYEQAARTGRNGAKCIEQFSFNTQSSMLIKFIREYV